MWVGSRLLRRVRSAESAEAVAELCKVIGVPRLGQIGVSAEALHAVVARMSRDAVESGGVTPNPRPATVEQIEKLYIDSI
ncbi:MAG: hypothetical protein ACOX87_02340 [Chloroflexota bacterium]